MLPENTGSLIETGDGRMLSVVICYNEGSVAMLSSRTFGSDENKAPFINRLNFQYIEVFKVIIRC